MVSNGCHCNGCCIPTWPSYPRLPDFWEPANTRASSAAGFLLSLKIAFLLTWQPGRARELTLLALIRNIQRLMWVDVYTPQQHCPPVGRALRPQFHTAAQFILWDWVPVALGSCGFDNAAPSTGLQPPFPVSLSHTPAWISLRICFWGT